MATNKRQKSWVRSKGEATLVALGLWSIKRFAPRLLKRYGKFSGGWVFVILAIFDLIRRYRLRH